MNLKSSLKGCIGKMQGNLVKTRKLSVVLPILAASFVVGTTCAAESGPGGASIDCAILLCMGGGFPASPECSAAKAEVVRRVTPNPRSEPPLQLWNCPMAASFSAQEGHLPAARFSPAVEQLWRLGGTADVHQVSVAGDASDTATLAFLRSIRVYNIMRYRHIVQGRDGECVEQSSMKLGRYGADGAYRWSRLRPSDVPSWIGMARACNPPSKFRGVAFEWTDYMGEHGTEVVQY